MTSNPETLPPWLGAPVFRQGAIYYAESPDWVGYPEDGNRVFREIEESSFWYRHRNNVIVSAVTSAALEPGGVFLEVGAGNGFVSRAVKDASRLEVVSLEPDPEGASAIAMRGIKNVVCSAFQEEVIVQGSLAGVGMFDVLEHVPDERKFLGLAKDALQTSGKLFLTVPAYNWLWSIEDDHDQHLRRYTRRRLVRLLEAAGFTVDYATYCFALLPLPILFFRTIPSALRLGNKGSSDTYHEHRADQYMKDHTGRGGWLAFVTNCLFAWEMLLIRRRMVIPFGGSVVAIATKSA